MVDFGDKSFNGGRFGTPSFEELRRRDQSELDLRSQRCFGDRSSGAECHVDGLRDASCSDYGSFLNRAVGTGIWSIFDRPRDWPVPSEGPEGPDDPPREIVGYDGKIKIF